MDQRCSNDKTHFSTTDKDHARNRGLPVALVTPHVHVGRPTQITMTPNVSSIVRFVSVKAARRNVNSVCSIFKPSHLCSGLRSSFLDKG